VRVSIKGLSHVGKVRKNNQDSFYCDDTLGLALVADGIGGRKGGEIASGLAVHGLRTAYMGANQLRHGEINNFLISAVDQINTQMLARGREDPRVEGMGTTLECLVFAGNRLNILHIGDSRTYLYFERHFWQLTIDHNVGTFVSRGWLPAQQVHPSTRKSALVRGLGLGPRCEPDVYEIPIQPGQVFLSCSDGLYDMVSDADIAGLISAHRQDWRNLPSILIDAALANGGSDNVTVTLSVVEDE
jgi:PPM family protein phosphatase